MSTFQTRLAGREEVAEGTVAFHFERPAEFSFKAGQAIDLVLNDPALGDAQNARHAFSLVSTPHQAELTIATRLRDSAFKRALKDLPIGAAVQIDGPFGSLTLPRDRTRPAILIAGGIGITPYMSMLRQAAHEGHERALRLLYSNRRPEDAAFLDELRSIEQHNPNFRMNATMTQPDKSARRWDGATGALNAEAIREAAGELAAPIYYLAGPPAMVAAMREILDQAGVDEEAIRGEEFFGY